MKGIVFFCCTLLLGSIAAARANEPQDLAAALSAAYKAGDMDGAMALFNRKNPKAIVDVYMDRVAQCFETEVKDFRCTFRIAPMSPDVAQMIASRMIDSQPAPLGVVVVTQEYAGEHPHKAEADFPYAKIDGNYVITGFQMDPGLIAQRKKTTAQSIAERMLAQGPFLATRDPQWKNRAHALPSDGGEPGAALVARTQAMAAALKANDVAAMIVAEGGSMARWRYVATHDGKPVSMRQRQLTMQSHMNDELADVHVLGGWQLDDFAILVIEGHSGGGEIVRGWQSMRRPSDGHWDAVSKETLGFPLD